MFNFIYPQLEAFGLDLSDYSLKIAKIDDDKKKNQTRLVSYGAFALTPGLVEAGRVMDHDKLTTIIKESMQKVEGKRIRTKAVVAAIPEEQSFVRLIQLPPMPEKELPEAVSSETEGNIPLSIDEVYYDWRIITKPDASSSGQANDARHYDILVAATPKQIVDEYELLLQSAGLLPVVFEPESFAITRSILRKQISYSPLLLVDIGDTHTTLAIVSGTSIRVTASVAAASGSFAQLISSGFNVSLVEAESMKQIQGISQEGEGLKIFKVLQDPIEDLLRQIKGYLAYYASHSFHEHQVFTLAVKTPEIKTKGSFDFRPISRGEVFVGRSGELNDEVFNKYTMTGISRIFLTGGGANLAGLPEYLSANLKISVQRGDPLVNIIPPARNKAGMLPFDTMSFATVLGLAMHKPGTFI